jgi:hypothetical protein
MVAGMTSQETNQILIAGACDDLLGGTSLRNHYLCSIFLTFFMRQVIAYNAQYMPKCVFQLLKASRTTEVRVAHFAAPCDCGS